MDGKMQIQGFDGSWSDVGYITDGLSPTFVVEDEAWQMPKLDKSYTFTVQTQPLDADLMALYTGKKAADIQPYIDQMAAGTTATKPALEIPPPLMPSSIDEIPGNFPTAHLGGTPSAAKQKFIDQIEPCELSPQEKMVMAVKASQEEHLNAALTLATGQKLGEASIDFQFTADAMFAAVEKAYTAFSGLYAAIQPMAMQAMEEDLDSSSNVGRAEKLRRRIPGVNQHVKMPCDCDVDRMQVWYAIQHLNDIHNPASSRPYAATDLWSRERIADWLETLDVDLRVQDEDKPSGCCDHRNTEYGNCTDCHNTGHAHPATVACSGSAEWTPDQLAALKKAIEVPPMHPGKVHHQLGIEMPPMGLADVVSYWMTPAVEGKIVQYEVNANVGPPSLVFTVEWPDGTKSTHPREDLVLVEAYSPPTDEITDWGINKITYNNISPA